MAQLSLEPSLLDKSQVAGGKSPSIAFLKHYPDCESSREAWIATDMPGAKLHVLSYGTYTVSISEPETFNQTALYFLLSEHAMPISAAKAG
ncbi:hypothetical protein [Xylophilus sp.]|uniref:hypothetical protein n=1 Tax=Xylophilus sp. TaxID=2653893 RepID=UPI002D7E44E4|nr:hypothetical protein [Xylophilus sp.]